MSPRYRTTEHGVTLIELLGSLALLAILLVGILSAQSGARRQAAAAQQRIDVIGAADRLLTSWYRDEVIQVPWPAQGTLIEASPSHALVIWRTSIIPSSDNLPPGTTIVRFEATSLGSEQRIVSVDLLVPDREDRP